MHLNIISQKTNKCIKSVRYRNDALMRRFLLAKSLITLMFSENLLFNLGYIAINYNFLTVKMC